MDFVIDVVQTSTGGKVIYVSFLDTKDMVHIILDGVLSRGDRIVAAYCYHNGEPLWVHAQFLESVREDVRSFCIRILKAIVERLRPDLMEKESFQRIQEHEHIPEMEKAVTEFIDRAPK